MLRSMTKLVKSSRDGKKRFAGETPLSHEWDEVSINFLRALHADLYGAALPACHLFGRESPTIAERDPAGLGSCEAGLRSLGDQLAFVFAHGCKNLDRQPICVRIVAGDEFDAALEKLRRDENASG